MTALLSATDLGLTRGERRLFGELTFALEPGELLRIEGHNGSGKTSLLKLIAGLTEPETGDVRWDGRSIRDLGQAYRANLVWLGHKVGLKGDLTLLENLRFERALRPPSPRVLSDVLARLELERLTGLPLRALSAGQQRRAALARLLLSGARLWLLDEPYTNLDRDGRALIGDVIDEHLARGGLCVTATHQPLDVERPLKRLALS